MQSSLQDAEQPTAGQRRREVLHKAKPGAPGRQPDSPLHGADSLEGSSSASMQAARSQEGDFFRLLDSAGPALRVSFQESDLEQLPRSFSMGPKAKLPALDPPPDESSGAENGSSSAVKPQQEADLRSSVADERGQAPDLASMPALDIGAAESHQGLEQLAAPPDAQPVRETVGQHDAALPHAHDDAHLSKELQRLQSGSGAGDATILPEEVVARQIESQEETSATSEEGAASAALDDKRSSRADGSASSQLPGRKRDVSPPHDHSGMPGLMGGAASSDLSYTQLTALLGNGEAQEEELSELDALSAPSTPETESDDMAPTDAEGLVACAGAAAAAVPHASEQLYRPSTAETHLDRALDAAQAGVMLPEQHDSAAGDADLADTLEHARDEQRLEQVSQRHAARDLESSLGRLAALTGRQGGPISDAEHASNMQRLAELTGTQDDEKCQRSDDESQPQQMTFGTWSMAGDI